MHLLPWKWMPNCEEREASLKFKMKLYLTVPASMKQARVKPLYKKGSQLDDGNYRPVSI